MRAIRDHLPSIINREYVDVDSIDAFQGREKEVIVVSCVRSGWEGSNNIGFVADIRRLNVALTRARRLLWVVGNGETLGKGSETWRSFVDFCKSENLFVDLSEKGSLEKATRDSKSFSKFIPKETSRLAMTD